MGLALALTLVGTAGLVLAGFAADLGGGWGWLIAAPLVIAALTVLLPSARIVSIGSRTIARRRGDTVLRLPKLLTEREERDLYRRVDLLRGRLRQAIHGLDDGLCEVWVLRRPADVQAVRRAWWIGVGRLGRPICPITLEQALDPALALPALAGALARNATSAMTRRPAGFLGEGLTSYLTACALHPDGANRRLAIHQAAADAIRTGADDLTTLLQPGAPHGPASCRPLGRSFTGFLMQRYGLAPYLRMLNHADRHSAEVSLLMAYGRSSIELERRWRVFLQASEPVRTDLASA